MVLIGMSSSSTPMSSSSAPLVSLEEQPPLPLMVCPFCNNGMVQWWVSRTTNNPGKHFYKCEHEWTRKCNFWKWEENYINVIRAKWPRLFTVASREDREFHRIIIALLLVNLLALFFVCCKVA
ncbi:hypothetical protein CFC21_051592 [Triticum aestivum]|uniref:GRF-type domain-containing protein n=2 Tax=Triticum aestivum TaxID=4565 RepID=A0A9R1G6J7_WHEAT|nr:hypothetical protein CFC21_051592 [Triticum aestivum]